MGDDGLRDQLGDEQAPNPIEGTLAQRHAEYLAALTPSAIQLGYRSRKPRYIDDSSVAWMIVAHAMWIIAPALIGGSTGVPGWFAVASAHLVALFLVVAAWAKRARSVAAARAVAWGSTPLLGACLALLPTAFYGGVVAAMTDESNRFEAFNAPIIAFFAVVVVVALSVPTIGAFLAAVSHARSLRGS